jgi:hypothetical protein
MKYFFFTLLLLITVGLRAQDGDPESPEVEVPVEETPADDTEEYYDDEEPEENPHTLVKPSELHSTKNYTSEEINQKDFDNDVWKKVVGNETFSEEEEEEEEEEKSQGNNLSLPSAPWAAEALKAVAYAFLIAIVVFLLYFVLRNIKISKRAAVSSLTSFVRHDDNIHELDLPELLKQALAEKNLRLAVRFYYLLLLKNLHDAGMIKWEKDKTNREYLSELFNKEYYYDEVRKLTRGYEEVWFSDHMIADESLRTLIAKFDTIQEKLNQPRRL